MEIDPSILRWVAGLAIGIGIAAALRGIADDVDFDTSLLQRAFSSDAGVEVSLPAEVLDARSLLSRADIGNAAVALDPRLKDDPLLQQRMWEGLYPVKLHDADTGLMLWMVPGPARDECIILERSERLVLVDCP